MFFGLVGAVGIDFSPVITTLENELTAVGYSTESIVISRPFEDLDVGKDLERLRKKGPEEERILQSMKVGTGLRSKLASGDAAARLAIAEIRRIRDANHGDREQPLQRKAFIFKSLKHPEEVRTLRNIYGDSFFLISIYEPRHKRLDRLAKHIAKSHGKRVSNTFRQKAEELDKIDASEPEQREYGQLVSDTFHLADVFINQITSPEEQIIRFIRLLFGSPFITPTVDEYGLFHAKAVALRSADPSRQVGAVICTSNGELIAAGCNEVPLAGGGAFWEGTLALSEDNRDFRLGSDSSSVARGEIVEEILQALKERNWLNDELINKTSEQLRDLALKEGKDPPLRRKQVNEVLEYGRVVHAEMHAISEAARRGLSIKGATLYCTTFPCHNCARHIISSGIGRVVYIEPYPKSMTKDLYARLVRIDDEESCDEDAIKFDTFIGISPDKYFKLFRMVDRKDENGEILPINHIAAQPRLRADFELQGMIEQFYVESLEEL